MRILVTGANGQLGCELVRHLSCFDCEITAPTRRHLDISISQQVFDAFSAHGFDLVINAAAYTDVDGAETDEETAFLVNAEAPGRLARACASHGAVLIHVSTDYVFDGSKPGVYLEHDAPSPANAYGRTKETGERVIRDVLDQHLIIRTAWLFGAHGRNFVKTMLRLASEREEIAVVADQRGNPTAAADLAGCIAELVSRLRNQADRDFAWGTYHCVNQGTASWYEFADAIVDRAAPIIGRRPLVRSITTEDYPTPAARPRNSQLDCTKLLKTFGITMPPWRESLPGVIDQIITGEIQDPARSAQ